MPTLTYTPLASAASVTFSSISQAYRDLVLVTDLATTASAFGRLIINGDTTAKYNFVSMSGNGSATSSANGSDGNWIQWPYGIASGSGRWAQVWNFLDYSATDKHKSILSRENDASNSVYALAWRYASTTGITSLQVTLGSSTFVAGSTFSLYGIAA